MAWRRCTTERISGILRDAEVKLSRGETVDHSPLSIDQFQFGQLQQRAGDGRCDRTESTVLLL
jgi:hypothetical protein